MNKIIKGLPSPGDALLLAIIFITGIVGAAVFSCHLAAGSKGLTFDQKLGIYRHNLDRLIPSIPGVGAEVTPIGECISCRDIPATVPLHCSSCEAYVCTECFDDYRKQANAEERELTCPHCQKKIVSYEVQSSEPSFEPRDTDLSLNAAEDTPEKHEVRYNLINEWGKTLGKIDVLCDNEGCKWTVAYGEGEGAEAYKKHRDECEFQDVDCPQGCGKQILRNRLDQHREVCEKTPVACPECEDAIPCDELTQHRGSNGCKVQKAARLLGRMSLKSTEQASVMTELLTVQQELVASMHSQILELQAEKTRLVAKVEAQNRQLHFSSSVTGLEGGQFVTVNLHDLSGASMPTMPQVYYSKPFTVAGNIHGETDLIIAVIYHGSDSFSLESPDTADVYLLGDQELLDRITELQETLDVELFFLTPAAIPGTKPCSLELNLSRLSRLAAMEAPYTSKICKSGFYPLGYDNQTCYRTWLVTDEYIRSRAATVFVKNRFCGSHWLDHLSLTPNAGMISRYQSSPVTVLAVSFISLLIKWKFSMAVKFATRC